MRAMAESFRSFRNVVSSNVPACFLTASRMDVDDDALTHQAPSDHAPTNQDIYDDYEGKLSAWRTALYIAGLTVQIDMEIVARDRACREIEDLSIIGYL